MSTVVDSLNTKQSMGQGTGSAATVHTDHIAEAMTGKEETATKLELRPKSHGESRPVKKRRNLKINISEALSQVLNYLLGDYRDTLNETGTKMDNPDYSSSDGKISDPCNNSQVACTLVL